MNEAASPTVPASVRIVLKRHLDALQGVVDRLEQGRKIDKRFGGGGRYEWECLLSVIDEDMGSIRAAREAVAEFRTFAPKNGVEPEVFLASLGGVPDLKPSAKAIAFMSDDGKHPLPEKVAAYVAEVS